MPFFGGQDVIKPGNNIQITYSTPQYHTVVYFWISAVFNGDWQTVDGIVITFGDGSSTLSTVDWQFNQHKIYSNCSNTDFLMRGRTPHSGSTLNMKFTYRGPASTGGYGIRKVNLRLSNEPPALDFCVGSNDYYQNALIVGNICQCFGSTYWDGSLCQKCDDSCQGCSGPTATECYVCQYGYYHDGTQCQKCSSTCTNCDTCGICPDSKFYMDHTCVPKCDPPFIQVVSFDRRYCFSPCSDTEVIYSDGTCNTTCITPFIYPPAVDYTRQVCQSDCNWWEVRLPNGTCITGPCPYPRFDKVYQGNMKVCEYPCPNYPSEIYYHHNNSCMPSCNFPFITVNYGEYDACEVPCPGGGISQYWDTSCPSSCVPLLQQRTIEGIQVCDPPQCGAVFCSTCGAGNSCPEYYYCNTTIGKFCFPYNTYSLEVEVVRPILNGIVLTVEVVPVIGITTADDILEVKLYNLQLGTDYTFTSQRLSKGKYEVEIVIYKPINSTAPKAAFVFAPNTLLITSDYTLNRITYINEGTQAAAQDGKRGSQIAFLIFVLSIIGMVMSGGFTAIWTAIPESQYAYYLLYINIDFLHHTEVYFESLSNYDILVDSAGDEEEHLDLSYRSVLPRRFYFRDYDPDFVGNCGELALQAIGSFSALIISILIIKHIRFSGRGIILMKLILYIRRSLHWNLIIRQFMTYALPVLIAGFIQIHSLIFGLDVYWPSLALTIVSMIAFPMFYVKTFKLVYNAPTTKYDLSVYSRRFGTLWEDLDVTMKTKYYYWIVALRAVLIAYVVSFFGPFPYIQIITLIIYQACIVSLFIKIKPFGIGLRLVFGEKTLNKITFLEELCLLLVKILMLIFHTMIGTVSDKTLILVGWIIIIPAAVAQGAQIFYSIYGQLSDCDKFSKLSDMWKTMTGVKKMKKIVRIKRRGIRIKA